MLCSSIAKSCNRYALYLHSGMDILSSCFLSLAQDAPALPLCRAFIATATTIPGINPPKPDVPPKPRSRTSSAVLTWEIDRLSRPSPQQINLTARSVFTLLASLKKLKIQELVEWIFRTFSLSFIPTKSNHPESFFLRGISPLKVFPLEDDA